MTLYTLATILRTQFIPVPLFFWGILIVSGIRIWLLTFYWLGNCTTGTGIGISQLQYQLSLKILRVVLPVFTTIIYTCMLSRPFYWLILWVIVSFPPASWSVLYKKFKVGYMCNTLSVRYLQFENPKWYQYFTNQPSTTVAYNCRSVKRKHTLTRCKFQHRPAANQLLQNDPLQNQT